MKTSVSKDINEKMRSLCVAILLTFSLLAGKTEASCKAHDAKWNKGVSLRITQPARSEPDKVIVDWHDAIYNARCVDFYTVYG